MDECDYSRQISLDSGIDCEQFESFERDDNLKKFSACNEMDETYSQDSVPDLDQTYRDLTLSLDLMLSNRFEEGINICDPWAKTEMYYASNKCLLLFLQAILTLEKEPISQAIEEIGKALNICVQNRKVNSISESVSSWIWNVDYNDWTVDEVHAELCYAELQTMITILTFFETQSIMSLIKGAFRLRASHNAYKLSEKILNAKTQWDDQRSRDEFETGVRMGIGITNLILSHLPSKILKLISLVGFSGDFNVATKELRTALTFKDVHRYRICAFIVISYNLYMEQVLGIGQSNIKWAKELLDDLTRKFPDAALLMFFVGRLQQLTGNLQQAITTFSRCIKLQNSWTQVHNICYWDMTWCYALLGEWKNAEKYADILTTQCSWLPSVNAYQSAIFKCMRFKDEKSNFLQQQINDKMSSVIELRKRYAGKTFPPEKLAITRSQQYLNHINNPLPAFEYFYVWNMFSLCCGKAEIIEPMIAQIDVELEKNSITKENVALLLLLKGVCLRNLNRNKEAIRCLENVFVCEKYLCENSYIPAHSALELGLTYIELRDTQNARHWLNVAKKGYKKYLIEAVVHLRVHSAKKMLKKLEKGEI